jgi:hypothetical protein
VERKNPWRGRPEYEFDSFYFLSIFGDRIRSSEAAMGGGAQRPVWRGNEPKKTGARSARARTRGQNPLVSIYLPETTLLTLCSLRKFANNISTRQRTK